MAWMDRDMVEWARAPTSWDNTPLEWQPDKPMKVNTAKQWEKQKSHPTCVGGTVPPPGIVTRDLLYVHLTTEIHDFFA